MLTELRLEHLRRFDAFELRLEPGWNAFVGSNGAGKTTILEAAFLLSHGRSFRSGGRVGIQQDGASGYSVFGRFVGVDLHELRAGLARVDGRLVGRINGETVGLSELVRACPVVCFEPGSHELISGGSELRRQFLDWGVFHVEPSFLGVWRHYQRALRQRNALLRAQAGDGEFLPWNAEMASAGRILTELRRSYLDRLRSHVETYTAQLLPELGASRLAMNPGWDADTSLDEALASGLPRDRERCHTVRGPHRADWSLRFERATRREHFSRGQEKLIALIALLAQSKLHADVRGSWPVFCFDDLASELDQQHQAAVIEVLSCEAAQVLVTGTEVPQGLQSRERPAALFHVEHGSVSRLI